MILHGLIDMLRKRQVIAVLLTVFVALLAAGVVYWDPFYPDESPPAQTKHYWLSVPKTRPAPGWRSSFFSPLPERGDVSSLSAWRERSRSSLSSGDHWLDRPYSGSNSLLSQRDGPYSTNARLQWMTDGRQWHSRRSYDSFSIAPIYRVRMVRR